MFETISISERVRTATEKTRRVVDHLLYLIELHENNAIAVSSPILSAQIPTGTKRDFDRRQHTPNDGTGKSSNEFCNQWGFLSSFISSWPRIRSI